MKLNRQAGNAGFTLKELLVILIVLAVLAMLFLLLLPLSRITARAPPVTVCENHLRLVTLAFRLWENDHLDKFPTQVPVASEGAMESALNGDLAAVYRVMSNELDTPEILVCPADLARTCATNFETGLQSNNLSYFVSLDADETNSASFLCGDANLSGSTSNGRKVATLTIAGIYSWDTTRHLDGARHSFWLFSIGQLGLGNIGSADGHVSRLDDSGLNQAWLSSGMATNRLLMP